MSRDNSLYLCLADCKDENEMNSKCFWDICVKRMLAE